MWALELLSRFRSGWVRRHAASETPDSSLHELIDAGESETLEFKSSIRWDRREKRVNKTLERVVAKTVAGFLNGRGGTLLLGVEDTGAVCGLDADFATLARPGRDAFERHVRQVLTTHLGGSVQRFVSLSFGSVAGADVCRIEIARGDSPVYVREGNDPRLYVRMGNATAALPVDEAVRYVGRRWAGQAFGGLLETVFGRRR
jgi:predicted HTH transcriptional regulator